MSQSRAIYSDINQNQTGQSTDKEFAVDVESVYQSIRNILSTPIGTRFFLPEFGSELEELLFEPIDDITEARIYDALIQAIDRWEPRVQVDYGRTTVTAVVGEHKYDVTLVFRIVGLSERQFEYTGQLVKEGYHG